MDWDWPVYWGSACWWSGYFAARWHCRCKIAAVAIASRGENSVTALTCKQSLTVLFLVHQRCGHAMSARCDALWVRVAVALPPPRYQRHFDVLLLAARLARLLSNVWQHQLQPRDALRQSVRVDCSGYAYANSQRLFVQLINRCRRFQRYCNAAVVAGIAAVARPTAQTAHSCKNQRREENFISKA